MAELIIGILILITLVLAITTFAQLSIQQLHLRRDVRAEAGEKALTASTEGWVDPNPRQEERSHTMHRINAFARLETFEPAFPSKLPSSNYTLAGRDLPEAELGLTTVTREKIIPLDDAVMDFVYPKGTIRLRETTTFPAMDHLFH